MALSEGLLRTHNCGELRVSDEQSSVILCGWVNKYRNLGGLHFVDLRDKYGVMQLSFENFKGDLNILKTCQLESVILAKGKVVRRPSEAINKKMGTGEIEIDVESVELLSGCDIDTIPFLPHGLIEATEDHRLKYRYLDLRTDRLQKILALRSRATLAIRNTLHNEGFIEVETPILYKSTPEGARDYIVPSRVHPRQVYALPQSPQMLKQLLMIGGTDKYFQLCRCFRDEDLRADRQPEFTQIDMEVSFASQSYIKGIAAKLVKEFFNLEELSLPSMTYSEAMRRFGSDKPDIRFDLEHHEVNEIFSDSDFGVFKGAIEGAGLVKAMFVPKSVAQFSRKDSDDFVSIVRPHGGKGVAFFKVDGGKMSGGISKFITEGQLQKLTQLESGDGCWLFFADSNEDVAHASGDVLRRHLGEKYALHKKGFHFLWVYDFPLLEWGGDRFMAKHHPFTSPKPAELENFFKADHKKADSEFKTMCADAYDIVCNGYEIGGGSIRIHRQDVQKRMFEVLGLSESEVKSQFGFFVDALKYGTPPHGGMALGLDRMVMILAGTDNIRDVMAFPKTTSASDLMSGAPSMPIKEQMDELFFTWK